MRRGCLVLPSAVASSVVVPSARSAVVEDEGVAVGGEDKGHAERQGVIERLLHPGGDGEAVVLDLDDRDWDAIVIEDVVGALGLAAGHQPAALDDAALGEIDLSANLGEFVPTGQKQGRSDEFDADVVFAQGLLADGHTICDTLKDFSRETARLDSPTSLGRVLSESTSTVRTTAGSTQTKRA
jgi:hypothetical protein